AIRAATAASSTIPIVMAPSSDPVGLGFVSSLARPGGNVTGLTNLSPELSQKRLEFLRETVPGLSRVGVLWYPDNPAEVRDFELSDRAAESLGLQLHSLGVRSPADFEAAFSAALSWHAEAMIMLSNPDSLFSPAMVGTGLYRIRQFAAEHRLPAMYAGRSAVHSGGLMSYASSTRDLFERAAAYVDKILKGAKPADLPVEGPTKFDFVINKKTADSLGLTIPESVLQQATELIQG
ncbi:MAG TPA: ABC transporter substrate-binding protein, partial [Candidatus Binatia bacterium]|nr:ABC transporter substrate-binding protein [Candidatus Binatia bacterium]